MSEALTVNGKRATLEVDAELTSVRATNTQTGTPWVLCEPETPLLEVWLGSPSDPGPERVLGMRDYGCAPMNSSPDRLVLAGESDGVQIELTIAATKCGHFEWLLRVRNDGSAEVRDLVFPRLVCLSPRLQRLGFTLPVNNGWWLPCDLLDEDETLTWNYPIFGSMQWIDLGNEDEGLYVACHDPMPLIKLMTVGKRNGKGYMCFQFCDVHLRPGDSVELPPVLIAPHMGDWRVAAGIYRDWAATWMERPHIPDWVLRKPHWAWMGVKGQFAQKPDRTYAGLPKESDSAAAHGIDVLQVGGWLENGHDARYPDYVAGACLGGEEGLTGAVRVIHDGGHRIALYTNGRLADPDSSLGGIPGWREWTVQGLTAAHTARMQKLHANFDLEVPNGQAWDEAGTTAKERYGIDFAVMCPSCPEWRSLFVDRLCYLAEKYHVDGIYLDQVCGCWAYPCYAKDHDHTAPNESWAGYVEMLRDLRARLRAIDPEIYLSTEGVGDIFGQFFDMLQGHNDWDTQVGEKALPMPELFRYTFPWLVVCTGPVYYHRPDLLKLAHLVGSGFDFCTMPAKDSSSEVLARSKQVLDWRERFWREMACGEFLGPCRTSHQEYRAFAFRGEDRLVVTLAWLPWKCEPDPPESVELWVPDTLLGGGALLLTESEGMELPYNLEEDTLRVSVPFAEIGLLIFDKD